MIAPIFKFLAEPATTEVSRQLRQWSNAMDVRHVAVMPDVHPAGAYCVGMVIGTEQLIYPAAVGGDIGCGIAACEFSADYTHITSEKWRAVLEAVRDRIPIQRHRRSDQPPLSDNLAKLPLSDPVLENFKRREGCVATWHAWNRQSLC